MMPIVVKSDDVRSGRKAKVRHRQFSKIQKLKSHESFYPHQALEALKLYLFAILKLSSVLRLETREF